MKFLLTVELDNAAFEESQPPVFGELARILVDLGARMGTWDRPAASEEGHVRDYNGNGIGTWEITEGPSDG